MKILLKYTFKFECFIIELLNYRDVLHIIREHFIRFSKRNRVFYENIFMNIDARDDAAIHFTFL